MHARNIKCYLLYIYIPVIEYVFYIYILMLGGLTKHRFCANKNLGNPSNVGCENEFLKNCTVVYYITYLLVNAL